MAIRSIRLIVFLIPLLALGTGTSLASPGLDKVAAKNPHLAAFCPADPGLASRRADRKSTRSSIAFKCRCCGRDENGHCNHQCCD